MKLLVFTTVLIGLVAVSSANSATLTVHVSGVRPGKGAILLSVCESKHFMRTTCTYRTRAPATAERVDISLPDIKPGVYAVEYFHDEDGSGRLPRSEFGIPLGGFGFSNDPSSRSGPPRFQDAKIDVPADGAVITTRIKYY